ncbi:MAG: electron transfer flavoprotein subunit alpha/FixB family protein [Dehalococcoidales bacterium]|nr:electron transfer flavoprotein subunit alpha/FixB family protein [Dehalococcoidales bacterium]
MARTRNIWVLPEINGNGEEISQLSLGLLTESRYIAEKVGGTVTALVLGDQTPDYSRVFGQYEVSRAYIFQDPLLQNYSAEVYVESLLPRIQAEKPWLFLMGHTAIGRELAPRLAALLETGVISQCAKIELSQPEHPKFYRPVYGDQLFQEVIFQTDNTMLVTMDPQSLNVAPAARVGKVRALTIEPKLTAESLKTRHLEYLPADFQTVDVADADTVISAGMGAATDELLPLVEELAGLIEGAIGTTRPVVDGGKIPRERMIGQTGKVVSPEFYLALGISGATHHVGGIQDSGKIVAINRDPQAPIFQSSDVGITADLKDVLPVLIERIKRARDNGEIL